MGTSYFATRISENLARTPEGFLLARGVTLARTGFQKYLVSDLPREDAERLGVDVSNGNAYIDLYRPAEQVFAPSTISSAEGKPVTLSHPVDFVNLHNSRQHTRGHAQAIRKGSEPLESGEWPLVGDLLITDAELIRQIDAGVRQISCGYNYKLARENDVLLQSNIVINHIAVVEEGRAGPEARINDAAIELATEADTAPPPKSEQKEPAARQLPKKEKVHVTNWLKHVTGLGLKALAADADTKPEQLAEAVDELSKVRARDAAEESEEKKKKEEKEASDAKRMKDASEEEEKKAKEATDKKARDEAEEKEKKEKESKEAADKAAKDAAEKEHYMPCGVKDCAARDCRMHDALDGILKEHPEEEDADVKELHGLMQQFKGPAGTDEGASEVIEPIVEGETADKFSGNTEFGKIGDRLTGDATANDAVARDAEERAFLKRMRPIIARSNDKVAIADFNARSARFTRSSKPSTASYAHAAAATGKTIDGLPDRESRYSAMNAEFAKMRGKVPQEVK